MDIVDRIDELVAESLNTTYEQRSGWDNNINQDRCPRCGRHWHGLPITQRIATMYGAGRYNPEYVAAEDDTPVICEGSDYIGPIRPPADRYIDQVAGVRYGYTSADLETMRSAWRDTRRDVTVTIGESAPAPQSNYHFVGFGISADMASPPAPLFRRAWSELRAWSTALLAESELSITYGRWLPGDDGTTWSIIVGGREPAHAQCDGPLPDITITFGPQNWHHELSRNPTPTLTPWWLNRQIHNLWPEFTKPDYPIPESPGFEFTDLVERINAMPDWAAPTTWTPAGQPAATTGRRTRRTQRRGQR